MNAHDDRSGRKRERGAVLLAAMLLLAALVSMSASIVERAATTAAELRARRSVLCARYAALGGLVLDAPAADAAALVDPRVATLVVSLVRRSPAWCVLRATATCDGATRVIEKTMADPGACP